MAEEIEELRERLETEIECLHDRIADLENAKIETLKLGQTAIAKAVADGARERRAFFLVLVALIMLSLNFEGDYKGLRYSFGGKFLPAWAGEAIAGLLATGSGITLLGKYFPNSRKEE
jgi:hypothetical protein